MGGPTKLEELSNELNRILAGGRPGKVLIIGHLDTGQRVDGNPVWMFELNVMPENGASYPLRHREVVSAAATAAYPDGSTLPCRIDPSDPCRIAFGDRPFL